jgi:hypothetical protein
MAALLTRGNRSRRQCSIFPFPASQLAAIVCGACAVVRADTMIDTKQSNQPKLFYIVSGVDENGQHSSPVKISDLLRFPRCRARLRQRLAPYAGERIHHCQRRPGPRLFSATAASKKLSTLRPQPHGCSRMTRVRMVTPSCVTLSFTTPRRFIPRTQHPANTRTRRWRRSSGYRAAPDWVFPRQCQARSGSSSAETNH